MSFSCEPLHASLIRLISKVSRTRLLLARLLQLDQPAAVLPIRLLARVLLLPLRRRRAALELRLGQPRLRRQEPRLLAPHRRRLHLLMDHFRHRSPVLLRSACLHWLPCLAFKQGSRVDMYSERYSIAQSKGSSGRPTSVIAALQWEGLFRHAFSRSHQQQCSPLRSTQRETASLQRQPSYLLRAFPYFPV